MSCRMLCLAIQGTRLLRLEIPYSEAQHALKMANYVRAIRTLPASLALHFKLLEDGMNYPTHLHSAFFRSDLSPKEEVIKAFLNEIHRK